MAFVIKRATKKNIKLRMALEGPGGSGKTYTALVLAQELGAKVGVIDTERGSAAKYSDLFTFDVLELDTFSPETYVEAIGQFEKAGYDVLIIDSLSHAWTGKDGALDQVNKAQTRNKGENSFTAWRDVTPMHNKMVDSILGAKCHIIATLRTKTDYVMEEYTDKHGNKKTKPVKIGLQAIQRDGLEYEFDVIADLDVENNFSVGKTRCPKLSQYVTKRAGREVAEILKEWLQGEPEAPPVEESPALANVRAAYLRWPVTPKSGGNPFTLESIVGKKYNLKPEQLNDAQLDEFLAGIIANRDKARADRFGAIAKAHPSVAEKIIDTIEHLESTGVRQDGWQAEVNQMFTEYDAPVLLQTLSLPEVERVIEALNKWTVLNLEGK